MNYYLYIYFILLLAPDNMGSPLCKPKPTPSTENALPSQDAPSTQVQRVSCTRVTLENFQLFDGDKIKQRKEAVQRIKSTGTCLRHRRTGRWEAKMAKVGEPNSNMAPMYSDIFYFSSWNPSEEDRKFFQFLRMELGFRFYECNTHLTLCQTIV